jgi:nitroreductase
MPGGLGPLSRGLEGSEFMAVELNRGLPQADLNDRASVLALLASRRSASAKAMGEPGPDAAQIAAILGIAVRVPDHGKLTPWRFLLITGEARARAGDIVAARWRALNPDHGEAMIAEQQRTFLRAPTVIAVVSTAGDHPKIPVWEQVLSAGAVCQNMLIAATAMGLGCQWITGWQAYDREVLAALGVGEGEKVAGFVYFGTPTEAATDRPRPEPESLVTRWTGP